MNINKKKRMWIFGGVLVVLVVAAIGVNQFLDFRSARQAAFEEAGTGEIVTAFIGDLAASATASGQVRAQREVRLVLNGSGAVATVYVAVGDLAQAGDPLLQLDTADLERAVASAQQTVAIQEANLVTLLAPASDANVASAEAAVASAQASLADLLDGPNADEIAAVEADVRAAKADIGSATARLNDLTAAASPEEMRAAEIALELAQKEATSAAEQHSALLVTESSQFLSADRLADMEVAARVTAVQANANLAAAQETLDTLLNGDPNSIASAQAGVAIAVAQRDAAQARLDTLLRGPTQAQIAAAEASLAQAEASLDKLLRGPSDAQIAAAEVALEQARINLQRAQNNLSDATLMAPFSGAVTAVHVREGELAGGVLVEMVDSDSLELVLDVDEVDIGEMMVGQTAVITLETWPDVAIDGEVAAIAPQATNDDSALATYEVYLSLGETALPILAGMTANADLITADFGDVLLVPNTAINADRETGTYSVNLALTDSNGSQTITETAVSIGLRDSRYTQIVSGIKAGDRLLIGNALPVQRFGPGEEGGRPPFMRGG